MTGIQFLQNALRRHQDLVWESMGKYSEQLGWGLSGIQPECWTLLDMAVKELVARRNRDDRYENMFSLPNMLGHKATDIITGLKGVVTAQAEFLHAPIRYELTPDMLNSGKPMDPMWLDAPRLKMGKLAVKPGEAVPTVKLGDEATDSLTGFKGIATGRFTFLNGCLRVEITPQEMKEGKPIEAASFDEQRLTPKSIVKTGGPFDSPPARKGPSR